MPSEAYNGLGMRLTKSDPTGSYSCFCDGEEEPFEVRCVLEHGALLFCVLY